MLYSRYRRRAQKTLKILDSSHRLLSVLLRYISQVKVLTYTWESTEYGGMLFCRKRCRLDVRKNGGKWIGASQAPNEQLRRKNSRWWLRASYEIDFSWIFDKAPYIQFRQSIAWQILTYYSIWYFEFLIIIRFQSLVEYCRVYDTHSSEILWHLTVLLYYVNRSAILDSNLQ